MDSNILQYLAHIPVANFEAYKEAARLHPVAVMALTSCSSFALGDFLAQFLQRRNLTDIEMTRVARSAVFGLMVHGPGCHYWVQFLEKYLSFEHAWWSFLPKMMADQTVWALFLNSCYTTVILSLQGVAAKDVGNEIKENWFTVISAGWKLWPFVHCFTFSSLIPVDLKILFADVVQVVWVVILSTLVNKDNSTSQPLQVVVEATPLDVFEEGFKDYFGLENTDDVGNDYKTSE
eukprot:CAMPEP_0196570850 /NCGR_PEP_ID=MMETSP1081-20130531/1032_1 /TAXON_ID=36882 /ORGANISM="Pyramimonas amylifera, Strain CCMP720" /LENGTH=233 /DNA_ID=CAMNT_0041887529 /DNA_START=593 /DNA_END=1294 /DNA_ORIENTATION=-